MCIPSFGSETTEIKDPEKLKFIQKFHSWRTKAVGTLEAARGEIFSMGETFITRQTTVQEELEPWQ